jgi:hypothetical protein
MQFRIRIAAVLIGLVALPGAAFAVGKSRPGHPPPPVYHPHPPARQQTAPSVPI